MRSEESFADIISSNINRRKMSGRKKHNEKWMNAYNDFVACYEGGMSICEIAQRQSVSSRTIYRFREYYAKQQEFSHKM